MPSDRYIPADATTPGGLWPGRLSDGTSAHAVPVRVMPRPGGLHIIREGEQDASSGGRRFGKFGGAGGQAEVWPWDALVAAGPLLKGEPPLLGHRDRPGARLFIADAAAVPELLRHAPRLKRGAGSGDSKVLLFSVLGGLLALALLVVLLFSSFSPARMIASAMPQQLFDQLGVAVVRGMGNGRVCADADGQAALQTLLLKLSRDREEARRYHVAVAPLDTINAFTAPAGHVVLAEELVKFARSPDEVAGVLAHEMGHADHQHPETSMVRGLGLGVLGMLLFGDSDIAGTAALLLQLSYSRDAEREADEVSIARLQRASIDPAALATFFERLLKRQGGDGEGGLTALFQTHPPTKERIARLRAAGLPDARPALDEAQWRALRNICRATMPMEQWLKRQKALTADSESQ